MISQTGGGPDAAPRRAAAPTLSIVIASWNDWVKLEKFLTSIYRNTLLAVEVLVIDNASSDGTPEYLQLRAAGRRIFCVPAARIIHDETSARGKGKRPIRIWRFHYNAYRLYTRWRTLGYWDPRSVLAGVALLGRALLLIGYHGIKRRRSEMAAALLEGRAVQSEPSGTGIHGR